MDVRLFFSITFVILSIALAVCAVVALRSKKEMGVPVGLLCLCVIPPVIGNFLIVISTLPVPALIGCYMYYVGIDFAAFALLRFTLHFCNLSWPSEKLRIFVLILFGIDVIQILANPIFGHAFGIEAIQLYGNVYYRMIPYLPQNLHRFLVYATLAAVLTILFVRMIHSSRIHARRYATIFFTLLIVILWCSFYVFSRTPLDRSMIGYAVFSLLAFYFSLYYKPVRLLDRIMVDISSELPDALFFFDDVDNCIWMNGKGRELVKVYDSDYCGLREKLEPFFEVGDSSSDDWKAALWLSSEDGRRHYVLERKKIRDSKGRIDGSFLNIHDDTRAQLNLKREAYNARHDELTGLYNRQYLYSRIEQLLEESEGSDEYVILFMNVRNFKLINETFGDDFGDNVLKRIAAALEKYFGEIGAVYGRLGGDTFGVCIREGAFTEEEGERLLSEFCVVQGEVRHDILLHVGAYRISDTTIGISTMFDRARMAAAELSDEYQTHIAWYDEEIRSKMMWEQQISSEIQDALKSGQIVPFLQPMVDAEGKIVGAEALARWNHPEEGFLSPAMFIPIIERNGLIAEMDRYIWRCACKLLAEWGDENMFLSVNISPKDFFFIDVAKEIRSLVKEFGIKPSQLRLEITETVMITDMENKIRILHSLQNDGFIIEMDDFGSGYSSLNTLKDMPIDVIKIDMAFLNKSGGNEKASKILRNIIHMSTDLEILPLTEGVETMSQFEALRDMGCQMFQGYYFARPMSAEQFMIMMQNVGQRMGRAGF